MMLTLNQIRAYCHQKPGVTEEFPFDEVTLVLKVAGKMFALAGLNDQPVSLNLKCDPDWANILRDHYAAVRPGYHMNKRHWNTVALDGSIPDDQVWEMLDHSYRLVVQGLSRAARARLDASDAGAGRPT